MLACALKVLRDSVYHSSSPFKSCYTLQTLLPPHPVTVVLSLRSRWSAMQSRPRQVFTDRGLKVTRTHTNIHRWDDVLPCLPMRSCLILAPKLAGVGCASRASASAVCGASVRLGYCSSDMYDGSLSGCGLVREIGVLLKYTYTVSRSRRLP